MAKPAPQKLPTEAQAAATSVTRAAIEARSISARTMIDAFERELATHPVPQRAGRLHYECARLFESPLGDLVKAGKGTKKDAARAKELFTKACSGGQASACKKK